MTGRGYFKSRLEQLNAKKDIEEKPAKPQDNHMNGNNNKTPVSPLCNDTINGNRSQVPRGRRALIAQLLKPKELEGLESRQNFTSTFKSFKIDNSKDLMSQTFPNYPVYNNDEVFKLSKSTSQNQEQSMTNSQLESTPIETTITVEKPPVISRVPNKSEKNNYHMTRLSSNYVKIELDENISCYEYFVTFNPPVDAKSARLYLINGQREIFPVKTFDGTMLFLPVKLSQNITTLMGKLKDGSEVVMTVKYKKQKNEYERMQFYNILFKSIMKNLGFVEFGKNYFDSKKVIFIPNYKIEIWPGYITIVENFENGIYMCCDISFRILRDETVLEVMKEIIQRSKRENSDFKQVLMSQLCNSIVLTRYNNKNYRIDDLDFSMTPLSTFNNNGIDITFVDYYKKMYGIVINDLMQPMIITKTKTKNINQNKDTSICCLVPELCHLTGLTEEMKNNFKLMKDIHEHTKVTPQMRQQALIDLVKHINEHNVASQKLKNWGLTLCSLPEELEGPVYKSETIVWGNTIRKRVGNNSEWTSDLKNIAMFTAVNILNWAILYNSKDQTTAKSFCKLLTKCGRSLGMDINNPIDILVPGSSPEAFVSTINNTVRNNSELQIVIIIFPNLRNDRYNAVKRICCAEIGIPSQVIISKTLCKPERLQSITQKIALQINCKTGGACWAIDIPLKNTIIIGIDTYHDKSKQKSSVVGYVASMDKAFTQWYSIAGIQKSTQEEVMSTIQLAFYTVLNKYKEINGLLPEKIIIYRDGVGDGDLKNIEEIELNNLKKSIPKYSEYYNPMITFIVVQKRINTKIYQFLDQKYANPIPGTVVDNTITRRNYFDFFLVSQHAREGTVNPTHYIVLENTCNLSTENVQRLSFKLCHLYYNWCGTIKVPAPIQYAHKLAYLIGENVRQMPSEKLADTLFFL